MESAAFAPIGAVCDRRDCSDEFCHTDIAIQETLEKAVVAELLPRDQRSLGLGILASANALGDLGSSVFVGVMLALGYTTVAFAAPAAVGALGVTWMWVLSRRGVVK